MFVMKCFVSNIVHVENEAECNSEHCVKELELFQIELNLVWLSELALKY